MEYLAFNGLEIIISPLFCQKPRARVIIYLCIFFFLDFFICYFSFFFSLSLSLSKKKELETRGSSIFLFVTMDSKPTDAAPASPATVKKRHHDDKLASPSKKTPPQQPKNWEFYGCTQVFKEYELLEKLGEGTFGEVHKARQKSSGGLVALKRIFLHNEKEGFPLTALREIRILKSLDHKNILPLIDMAVQRGDRLTRKKGSVYMVSPYMDHDMAGLLANPNVHMKLSHIKCYMKQLLEGINYLHQQNYLHRDIKTANILIDNSGNLLIADFGLARHYDEKPPQPGQGAGVAQRSYTSMVVTRWYRSPELILGESKYTTAIDMWGIGCVFGEMFRRSPILQGNSDTDQGHKIFQLLGSPNNENMPGWDNLPGSNITYGPYRRKFEGEYSDIDPAARSLLAGLLTLNPQKRLTAMSALDHKFFFADPQPCRPEDLPQYQESHELDARNSQKERANKPPPPPPVQDDRYDMESDHGYNGHHSNHHDSYNGHNNNNKNNHYSNRKNYYNNNYGPPSSHYQPPQSRYPPRSRNYNYPPRGPPPPPSGPHPPYLSDQLVPPANLPPKPNLPPIPGRNNTNGISANSNIKANNTDDDHRPPMPPYKKKPMSPSSLIPPYLRNKNNTQQSSLSPPSHGPPGGAFLEMDDSRPVPPYLARKRTPPNDEMPY